MTGELAPLEGYSNAMQAMTKAISRLDEGLAIPRFQPLFTAIFEKMPLESFEKIKKQKTAYLCTLSYPCRMPVTFDAIGRINEMIFPKQFSMNIVAKKRKVWFEGSTAPAENSGTLWKDLYLWKSIEIDEGKSCYQLVGIQCFDLLKIWKGRRVLVHSIGYDVAIPLWKNRELLKVQENIKTWIFQFSSYQKEGASLEGAATLSKEQLKLLSITDKLVFLRECSWLVVLASAVSTLASFALQGDVTLSLWAFGTSSATWLFSKKGTEFLEKDARGMIERKKRKATQPLLI